MPATSAGEPAAQIQGRLHVNAVNLLVAEKPSQGAENSSSGTGTPSSETGTQPQGVGSSSSGTTPCNSPADATAASPGVEPSPLISVVPNAMHHEPASSRSNLSVEETFDSVHAKGSFGADPPRPRVWISRFLLTGEGSREPPREVQGHSTR